MQASARLSTAVQAIEVELRLKGKQLVRAIITLDTLEKHFQADQSPEGWLRAYEVNAEAINAVVLKRWKRTRKEPIVLTANDF